MDREEDKLESLYDSIAIDVGPDDPNDVKLNTSDSFQSIDLEEEKAISNGISSKIEDKQIDAEQHGQEAYESYSESKGMPREYLLSSNRDYLAKPILQRSSSTVQEIVGRTKSSISDSEKEDENFFKVDTEYSGIRHFLSSEIYKTTRKGYSSQTGFPESKVPILIAGHSLLFHPESQFMGVWSLIIILGLIYSLYILPYLVAFREENDLLPLDVCIDVIFLGDIILSFLTARRKQNGKLETDKTIISKKYIRTWFFFDVLATFPFYLIDNANAQLTDTVARVPRMLRIFRLLRLIKVFKTYKYISVLTWLEYTPRVPNSLVRIIILVIVVVSFAHFAACLWYFWGSIYSDLSASWLNRVFADGGRPISEASDSKKYLVSIYWAFTTLTTVGYGDVTPETTAEVAYGIIIMLSGACFFTYLTATVASLIAESDRDKRIFRERVTNFERFCKAVGLSKQTQRKIKSDMSSIWGHSYSTIEWSEVMKLITEKHRIRIMAELFPDVLYECDLFNMFDQETEFLKAFIASLEPVTYTKGQFIARQGDLTENFCIMRFGKLRLSWRSEKRVITHETEELQTFGETGLFLWPEWRFSIQTLERTQVLSISRATLFDILDLHENCLRIFRKIALNKQQQYDQIISEATSGMRNSSPSTKSVASSSVFLKQQRLNLERQALVAQPSLRGLSSFMSDNASSKEKQFSFSAYKSKPSDELTEIKVNMAILEKKIDLILNNLSLRESYSESKSK